MNDCLNVLGTALQTCGTDPVTGFYRDGDCRSNEQDQGRHVLCAIMDVEFLEYSRDRGNDLITAVPQLGFPGLQPGDRWCVCAVRWKEAHAAGKAPRVVLSASHRNTLDIVDLDTLLFRAVDIPQNA